jgi:transcriptional regulator with XRE-family HTH domain
MHNVNSDLEALKELRKRADWTQEELSTEIGVSRSQVARYETGQDKFNAAKYTEFKNLLKKYKIRINYVQERPTDELLLMKAYRTLDDSGKKTAGAYVFDLANKLIDDNRKHFLEILK